MILKKINLSYDIGIYAKYISCIFKLIERGQFNTMFYINLTYKITIKLIATKF